ncbi:MAG: hypothetical protein PHN82_03805 [bacterium]|nr:hypothetical protein [bacterium]
MFNWYLPLRSYSYVGSITSWLYYPLFIIWPSPHSIRLLGVIALGIEAVIVGRLCGYGTFKTFLFMLLFMPYSNQHVIDSGPSAWQIVCILLIIAMTGKWVDALAAGRARALRYILSSVLLVAMGIWIKLSFLFFLPIIPLFVLYHIARDRTAMARPSVQRRFLAHATGAILVTGVLVGVLLNARVRMGDKRYYEISEIILRDWVEHHQTDYTPWNQFVYISRYFTNPLQSANMYFRIERTVSLSGVLLLACIVSWLGCGTVVLRRRREPIGFIAVNMVAILLYVLVVAFAPAAVHMHHLVPGYPFIILPMVYVLARSKGNPMVAALLAAFIALNLWQFFKFNRLAPGGWEDEQAMALVPRFGALNRALNSYSGRYVFVHTDWGFYHLKTLYGPRDQCNVAAWPLDSEEGLHQVRRICDLTGRRPMFLRMRERSGTDLAFLEEHFPGIVPMTFGFDECLWGVWYEPLWPMFSEDARRGRRPPPPARPGILRRIWSAVKAAIPGSTGRSP